VAAGLTAYGEPDVVSERLPNFFLAGVSKAGTSALHSYLDQHPQIYMSPIKEPTFFGAEDLAAAPFDELLRGRRPPGAVLDAYLSGPQAPGARHLVLEWESYVRLFRDVRDEPAIGESSVAYLWLPHAAGAIRAKLPNARLLFVLRDPAERLFTLHHSAQWKEQGGFRQWLQASLEDPRRRALRIEPARYGTHLARFLAVFPREQVRIHLYEDYRRDPQAVLRDIFAFLGVRADYPIDLSVRHNVTLGPRFPLLHALRRRISGKAPLTAWLPEGVRRVLRGLYRSRPQPPADPADRHLVIEYYRDEILRAQNLIGRDLSAWLR
jgi:hypothetical protein